MHMLNTSPTQDDSPNIFFINSLIVWFLLCYWVKKNSVKRIFFLGCTLFFNYWYQIMSFHFPQWVVHVKNLVLWNILHVPFSGTHIRALYDHICHLIKTKSKSSTIATTLINYSHFKVKILSFDDLWMRTSASTTMDFLTDTLRTNASARVFPAKRFLRQTIKEERMHGLTFSSYNIGTQI